MKIVLNGNGVVVGLSGFVLLVFVVKCGKVSVMFVDLLYVGGLLCYLFGFKCVLMLWLVFVILVFLYGVFFMMGNIKFVLKLVIEEIEMVEVVFFVLLKFKEEDLVGDEIVELEGESGEVLVGVDVFMI